MSECIGPNGEYSTHTPGMNGFCTNCGTDILNHLTSGLLQLARDVQTLQRHNDETHRVVETLTNACHASRTEVVGLKRELAAISKLDMNASYGKSRVAHGLINGGPETCEMCGTDHTVSKRAKVELFKPTGKWYTDECWAIPTSVPWNTGTRGALGPFDMRHSPDAHWDGPVYVPEQEPWGYSHLLLGKAE